MEVLRNSSCFPGTDPESPWFVTRGDLTKVLWAVTGSLLPLLLVAPRILAYVNGVAWRNPPVCGGGGGGC